MKIVSKKLKMLLFIVFIAIIVSFCYPFIYKNVNILRKTIYINTVLSQEAYSYLPVEAKEYIKEIYEETGKVILTEKNKEDNKLYLNPQYVEYLTYSEEEKDNQGDIPISMIIDYSVRDIEETVNIPSSYDLRHDLDNNYVTPVRDQGDLGICWAFATAGAAESHILKTTNTSYSANSKLISERQLDYATSRNGIKDYKSEYVSFVERSLGDGGNFYISTIALANGISLVDYNNFKEYDDTDLQRMELHDVLSYNKSMYEVNSTINFPSLTLRESTSILTSSETDIRNSYLNEVKKNIIENGAAYVGTLMDSSCTYIDSNLDNIVIDVYNCSFINGHAMQIIGWDDNIEFSYCADTKVHKSNTSNCNRVISGRGVWILKNSWGDDYQYPYLTYDSLYTTISFIDEVESSDNKNWDNNYLFGDGLEDVKSRTYSLNYSKIKDDELIKKVKFITEYPETKYNVKIKKKDGNYQVFSKTSDLPGLMTIDITEDILVNKDTEITIYSDNGFIDKVSIFTSNVNTMPYIDLSQYDNMTISDNIIRFYSETKNISSGSTITYKVYNSNEVDVSNKVNFENNIVSENNINTLATFSSELDSGTYRIDAIYNSEVIESINMEFVKITGLGTDNNPYIITNSTQLYQIRNDLDAYYELGNDIDLTEDTREGGKYSLESNTCPQGFGWEAIHDFSGSLDGKGHTIKGLYQNNFLTCNEDKSTWLEWSNNNNGLFNSMKGNATVKNLILEDFDMNCQGSYCGALVSKYIGNMDDSGLANSTDQTEYTATFENIAIKNSKIKGVYNADNTYSDLRRSYGGGLLGYLENINGNINISNIYLDIDLNPTDINEEGYLALSARANKVNIKNIRVLGDLQGKYTDGSGDAILIHNINGSGPFSVKNVVSTVTATNVMGSLLGKNYNSSLVVDGINLLNIEGKTLCNNNQCSNATNVNTYNKDTQIVEFTKRENYNSWEDFDSNWDIKTIDGIPRIPVLKFMDFEYTNISDITINQELNKKESIYDYLTPKIDAAKRLIFKSNNEEIVTISDEGVLIPQSTGNTTIHVESLYDGYIKDVPISVNYVPHYTVKFDANGGIGTMDSIEVLVGKSLVLPKNEFTKDYYELKEWNTKADGTGISYSDLEEIPTLNDKDSITLYAIWWGEERVVTFDANGGTVNPDRKIVRIREKYGELPIPERDGYGFAGWNNLSDSVYVNAFAQFSGTELIALWIPNAYTIIYNANGGKIKSEYKNNHSLYHHSETMSTSYGNNNQDKEIYDYLYEREGYILSKWNTKPDGTGTSYTKGQILNTSSNITLYAIWENDTGTITYNSNYGNNETKTQDITFNVDTKLSKNTFIRSGYNFKEWNTKSDGAGIKYNDEQIINISTNITLYAIWEESYDYIINNYSLDETNRYISKIIVDTDVNKFISNINLNSGYGVYVDTKIINNRQVLYTGGKTRITYGANLYREYTNAVIGDINGDGATNSADLLKIRQHLLGTNILSGVYFLSSDINYDSTINSADLLRVRQHLLGTKPIN